MASRPRWECTHGALWPVFLVVGTACPAFSGGAEGEHPLDVPSHGHQAPLAAHVVEPTQQKLAESERRFDDAEYRFRSLFAQGIELPAVWRL